MMWAAAQGVLHPVVVTLNIVLGSASSVIVLAQAGFDVHATDASGSTCLHAAAHGGSTETTELLLQVLCAIRTSLTRASLVVPQLQSMAMARHRSFVLVKADMLKLSPF